MVSRMSCLSCRLDVHVGSREIGQRGGRGSRLERGDQFRRRLRQQLNRFDRLPLQIEKLRLDLRRGRRRLRNMLHPRHREWRARQEIENAGALNALADDVVGFVGRGNVADDVGDRANPIKIVRDRDRPRPAFRCNRIPIGRCSRSACCAAAIDFGRPMVMGATTPGNSTVLRTGMMISASSGIGTGSVPAAAAEVESPLAGDMTILTQTDLARRNTMHPFTAKRLTA